MQVSHAFSLPILLYILHQPFLYKMPLVSERSHELVESLLLAGQDSQCHVPKYEEVAPPSKRLITAFIDFLAASGNATAAAGVCPIT